MKAIIKILVLLFVFFSSYSHSVFPRSIPFFGRITPADLFGIVAVLISPFILKRIKVPNLFSSYLLLLVCFTIGIVFSQRMDNTMIEISILAYLGVLLLLFINSYETVSDFKTLILVFAISSFLASIIGIWDILSVITGLPRLINKGLGSRLPSGTFRNGGQAGAYMLLSVSILFPVLTSEIKRLFSRKQITFITVAFTLSIAFIILNAKIAAMIGAAFGLTFYLISKRKYSTLLPTIVLGTGAYFLVTFVMGGDNRIANRLNYKFETRIVQKFGPAEESNDFFQRNWGNALIAFKENPLTGSGLGGFAKVYDKNEVHSTPMKILGETGIIGTIGYLLFTIVFISYFRNPSKLKNNPFKNYLGHMLPFVMGCYISWIYTYHLRKREFWVLVFVVFLVRHLAFKYDFYKRQNCIETN